MKKFFAVSVLLVVPFIAACGSVSSSVPAQPAPPTPQTVTVEVTPEACNTFMDISTKLVKTQARAQLAAGEALQAVSIFDTAGVIKANKKMIKYDEQISKLVKQYNKSKKACQDV